MCNIIEKVDWGGTNTTQRQQPPPLYLLCWAAGVQRLQVRLPGSNGNRVLISRITTPNTLHAEYTKPGGGEWSQKKRREEKKTLPRNQDIKKWEEEKKRESRRRRTNELISETKPANRWFTRLRSRRSGTDTCLWWGRRSSKCRHVASRSGLAPSVE